MGPKLIVRKNDPRLLNVGLKGRQNQDFFLTDKCDISEIIMVSLVSDYCPREASLRMIFNYQSPIDTMGTRVPTCRFLEQTYFSPWAYDMSFIEWVVHHLFLEIEIFVLSDLYYR